MTSTGSATSVFVEKKKKKSLHYQSERYFTRLQNTDKKIFYLYMEDLSHPPFQIFFSISWSGNNVNYELHHFFLEGGGGGSKLEDNNLLFYGRASLTIKQTYFD